MKTWGLYHIQIKVSDLDRLAFYTGLGHEGTLPNRPRTPGANDLALGRAFSWLQWILGWGMSGGASGWLVLARPDPPTPLYVSGDTRGPSSQEG